jgi:hypothetical protein
LFISTSLDRLPRNNHKQLGERKASINPKQPPGITMVSLGTICSARQAPDAMSHSRYTPPKDDPLAVYQTANPAAVICSPCTLNPTGGSDTQSNPDSLTLLMLCDLHLLQSLPERIIVTIRLKAFTVTKSDKILSGDQPHHSLMMETEKVSEM